MCLGLKFNHPNEQVTKLIKCLFITLDLGLFAFAMGRLALKHESGFNYLVNTV